GRVVYHPAAFERDSLDAIAARVPAERRCAVDAEDALAFACNAIVTAGAYVTSFASDALRAQLARWDHEVVVRPLGEFLRAGGGAKCLALRLDHPGTVRAALAPRITSGVRDRAVVVQGHLLDTGLMNRILDTITEGGGSFEIERFHPGLRRDQ